MSFVRRVTRPIVDTAAKVPPVIQPAEVLMYKGYRIEPESYSVNSTAWSPRVVVSLKTADGGSRRTPLYATSAAKFSSREEANHRAVDVAKTWIDLGGQLPGGGAG